MSYNNEIKNKASIEFRLGDKNFTVESNEVEAKIVKIIVTKEQSSNYAVVGDEIEYKIKIYNDSDFNLYNCEFKDDLNNYLDYEKGSFKYNGVKEHAHFNNHCLSYNITEIKKHETATITFDAKVK